MQVKKHCHSRSAIPRTVSGCDLMSNSIETFYIYRYILFVYKKDHKQPGRSICLLYYIRNVSLYNPISERSQGKEGKATEDAIVQR